MAGKALVTGSTGHIGNNLTERLLDSGREVRALVLPGESHNPIHRLKSRYHDRFEIIEGDILDRGSIPDWLDDVSTVFHLAGMIYTSSDRDMIARMKQVNVGGTANIAAAILQADKTIRMVYASSIEALKKPGLIAGDEDFDKVFSVSGMPYAASKGKASRLLHERLEHGLDHVIVCPTAVIGKNDYEPSMIGNVIRNSCKRIPFAIPGYFNWVDVEDVCTMMMLAEDKGKTGEYYLAYGQDADFHELTAIARAYDHKSDRCIYLDDFTSFIIGKAISWMSSYTRRFDGFPLAYAHSMLRSYKGISEHLRQKSAKLGYNPGSLEIAIEGALTIPG